MKILLKKPGTNAAAEIADKFNIKELIEFERFCRDNAQWDEMKKCFAPDSQVKISWYRGTGQGFVEASGNMKSYAPHKLSDTLVWLNGDKAFAITMATIQLRLTIDGNLLELQSDVELIYHLQKTNGTWLIVLFTSIYLKDALVPVTPAGNIIIPSADLAKFRESYASLSYTLNQEGYEIDNDLPGRDRPESVVELYETSEAWLLS